MSITPVPLLPPDENGKVPHDIGDEARAAIAQRLIEAFTELAPALSAETVRQLAMIGAANVRALLYELGVLRVLTSPPSDAASVEEKRRQALCSHYVGARSGGNDYIRCGVCDFEWDYRKQADPRIASVDALIEAVRAEEQQKHRQMIDDLASAKPTVTDAIFLATQRQNDDLIDQVAELEAALAHRHTNWVDAYARAEKAEAALAALSEQKLTTPHPNVVLDPSPIKVPSDVPFMKLRMHDRHDSTLPPVPGHLERPSAFRGPARPEFHGHVIPDTGRSALRLDGTLQGDSFLIDDQDRHDGEIARGRHQEEKG